MSTEQNPHTPHQPETAAPAAERPDPPDAAGAPEAVQAADVDRDRETGRRLDVDRPARGVDWVRTSDLLARGSGVVSRHAIDIEARFSRAIRHGIAVGATAVGRKSVQAVRGLSPSSRFGRDDDPAVEPRGIGRS